MARPGIEPRTPDLRVKCPTNWAMRPGSFQGIHVYASFAMHLFSVFKVYMYMQVLLCIYFQLIAFREEEEFNQKLYILMAGKSN